MAKCVSFDKSGCPVYYSEADWAKFSQKAKAKYIQDLLVNNYNVDTTQFTEEQLQLYVKNRETMTRDFRFDRACAKEFKQFIIWFIGFLAVTMPIIIIEKYGVNTGMYGSILTALKLTLQVYVLPIYLAFTVFLCI